MDILEAIHTRRSIRKYTDQPLTAGQLRDIIKAGTMAPSGLNNQPWRFVAIQNKETLRKLAKLTKYSHIIEKAPACIAVFIDKEAMYHETKDHQAIGACIQNMLLAAHGTGLGGVWLGEILKNGKQAAQLLEVSGRFEMMAVVALGYPDGKGGQADRKPVEEVILGER